MNTLAVREPDLFNLADLLGAKVGLLGLTLPEDLNEDRWAEVGNQVMLYENATNWILGDWWVHGEHNYGDRKRWVKEQRKKHNRVKSFKHLATCASVCRSFESSRRRELVSFEMHRARPSLKRVKGRPQAVLQK